MQIVINNCFGGFGVSAEAIRALRNTPCTHITKFTVREWYAHHTAKEMQERIKRDKKDEGISNLIFNDDDTEVILDDHRDEHRTCPYLISVVEQLGAKANGHCADLKIVEVPDGVDFIIEEYDGNEHVAEAHRTWG